LDSSSIKPSNVVDGSSISNAQDGDDLQHTSGLRARDELHVRIDHAANDRVSISTLALAAQ
jgi:hypothetical protein